MSRLKKEIFKERMIIGLIVSLLIISGCTIYKIKTDVPLGGLPLEGLKEEIHCTKWNITGVSVSEADAKLWCISLSLGRGNQQCNAVRTNQSHLIIEMIENNTQLSYLNYADCQEYQNVYVKK